MSALPILCVGPSSGTALEIHAEHGSNTELPKSTFRETSSQTFGIARITLLRAREAGRIRFFRIETRVLYCAEQLTEFLDGCERNRRKQRREAESQAPRKENRVSSGRGSVGDGERARAKSISKSRKKEQANLPFAANR